MKTLARTALAAVTLALAAAAHAQDVKFWMVTSSNEAAAAALQQIAKDFNAANPGANVSVEARSVDQHKAALRVAASSDQGPDIFFSWAGLGLGGEFVKAGMSAPMDRYYTQYKWGDRFLPTAAAFADLYPGAKNGVPYTFRGEALYYNKTLFSKAGITALPASYEELVAAADKLKKAGIPAITFGGSVNWHLMRLMDSILETKCGAATHDALKAMTLNWQTQACVSASFAEFHKWTANYTLKPFMGIDQDQSFDLFVAKRAAMMLEGDWLAGNVRKQNKAAEVGIFPFPTGTKRLYGFAEYLYVNPKGKSQDMSARFLDYMTSTAVQQKYLGVLGATSVNKRVQYKDADALDAAWLNVFNQFSKTFVNGDQSFPLKVTTEYFRVINAVASDKLDPKLAGAELQSFIEKR
jgi:raffinose/stachyose/melibiose transport system substrate-binding protein